MVQDYKKGKCLQFDTARRWFSRKCKFPFLYHLYTLFLFFLSGKQTKHNPVKGITFDEKGLKRNSDSIRRQELMPFLIYYCIQKILQVLSQGKFPDLKSMPS